VSSRKLRFDGWVLDPDSGDLERAGTRIRLQEQPAIVLRELITHAGSVVTREQLVALLWPKGVVDFDTGLNTAIRKLRSALGDVAEMPRYIETLPRRGYRFIGALDSDPEAAVPVSSASGASAGPVSLLHGKPTALSDVVVPAPVPSQSEPAAPEEATSSIATRIAPTQRPRLPTMALITGLAGAVLLTGVYVLWRAHSGASATSVRVEAPSQSGIPPSVAPTSAVAFSPPPHSIAVLPFVNMSGDREQDYFSDGISEELLNDLSRINELQVAARTSSFSFKGKDTDIGTIARKLNVGAVLEGSVRRSGHTVRITAQLDNAVTGFHIWSQTYDRELGDALKLQTEIANAVAMALKVTLLEEVGAKIEVGGTRNAAAYDAYLRAASAYWQQRSVSDSEKVIADYREAVRLDSDFALAHAGWSIALSAHAAFYAHGAAKRDLGRRARLPALKAVALAPDLAEGHLALAIVHMNSLHFERASEEYERAVALAPGNARILRVYGLFAVWMGHTDDGIPAVRRAAILDPLNGNSHGFLGDALRYARRYDEAMVAYQNALLLEPKSRLSDLAYVYYAVGNFEKMRSVCEGFKEGFREGFSQHCLALAYHKLGRHADAEGALTREEALEGDAGAVDYAVIYAQWGNIPQALNWLETALRLGNPDLRRVKAEPLLDPLRKEPRFQAIERELKFPR